MTTRIRPLLLATVIVVIATVLVGCTSGSADTSTSSSASGSDQDLIFGRGEVPDTVPADFPIPEQAQIGATLVNRSTGLTEMVVTYPANVPDVAANYETNLEALGYTVESSSGTEAQWSITFSRDDLSGDITLSSGGASLSSGTIRLIQPA